MNTNKKPFEGTYYLKNVELNRFLQIDDADAPRYVTPGMKTELFGLTGEHHQRWTIRFEKTAADGTALYSIRCGKSGMLLTRAETSVVQQPEGETVLRSQLWYIETVAYEKKTYCHFKPTADSVSCMSACSSLKDHEFRKNGRDVIMRNQNDQRYYDEWELVAPKTRMLLIVPGLMGSTLYSKANGVDAWMSVSWSKISHIQLMEDGKPLEEDVDSVNRDNYGALNIYQALYQRLENEFPDYDVMFFDYDFRRANTYSAEKLRNKINSRELDDVVIISHSMGGLVVAKLFAAYPEMIGRVRLNISLGTPYLGTAKCIEVMNNGQMFDIAILKTKFVTSIIRRICANCTSAYELMPTDHYEEIMGVKPVELVSEKKEYSLSYILAHTPYGRTRTLEGKPMVMDAVKFHESLYRDGRYIMEDPEVRRKTITIAGCGFQTPVSVKMERTDRNDVDEFELSGDMKNALILTDRGDTMVSERSAGFGTPDYVFEHVDHLHLQSDRKILNRIVRLIRLAGREEIEGISKDRLMEKASGVRKPVGRGGLIKPGAGKSGAAKDAVAKNGAGKNAAAKNVSRRTES